MVRNRIDITQYMHVVLWTLHDSLANNKGLLSTHENLSELLSVDVALISLSVDELVSIGFCEMDMAYDKVDVQYSVTKITKDGINVVEDWKDDYEEHVAKLCAGSIDLSQGDNIPASDRIVELSDNQRGEIIEKIDEVLVEIKKDQPSDNEFAAEKNALIRTLDTGKKLFESSKIQIDVAIALTIEPLKIFAKKYQETIVAGLINNAISFISKLIGLG